MNAAHPERPCNRDLPFVVCGPSDMSHFQRAKVRWTFHQDLPVTPDRLFDIFEDPESWPKWATGIGRVIWTSPDPYGVGTTRTVVFWGGMEVYEEFLAFDRGREMAFVFYGTSERVWSAFGEHYQVESVGAESCRLSWTVAYDPAGWFGVLHPLFGWFMRLNLRSYLWRLKRYCRRFPTGVG